MAYVVETITEGYEDTPLTKFPISEDTFPRMSDVSVTLLPIVLQYNQYISTGNKAAADQLIVNNPDLYNCIHDAEKWNMIRDALIAMQRFLLKVDDYYTEIVTATIGIDDNPTEDKAEVVSYSAAKVDSMFDVYNITLPLSGWSTTTPYTQTIALEYMKEEYEPIINISLDDVTSETVKKQIQKSWNFVDSIDTYDGEIVATCKFKKPICDIPLVIKGV